MLAEKFMMWKSEGTERALNIGLRRLGVLKNPSQFCSYVTTAGSSLYSISGALKRKISCQPTSIARRQIRQPRGKAALMRGRVGKRKRSLTHNINLNKPNGKIH